MAIIKSRLCRLAAAKVGVPVGHRTGYNYFLACDTAERIIFAVVTGSGSGKLCRHSRGNNNDQENAGYVRENGQRRTGVAREGFLDRRSKRCFWLLLSPQTKVARAGARNYPCAAAADNSEGRGWCAGRVAIIKSRLCRRKAAKVGVPVGHGYNYFLACDTAERTIFAVVAGSGSGKLCRHSRRNDNDQENAGYVRESAGGSEQA